jgi:hypothetical protein
MNLGILDDRTLSNGSVDSIEESLSARRFYAYGQHSALSHVALPTPLCLAADPMARQVLQNVLRIMKQRTSIDQPRERIAIGRCAETAKATQWREKAMCTICVNNL